MSATSAGDRSRRPPPLAVRFGRSIANLELTSAEHHVALAMVIYANKDGAGIRPSVERIARDTGLSESTVHRALHGRGRRGERTGGLLRAGVLLQVGPGGGRRPGSPDEGRPAEYRVNPRMVTEYPSANPVTKPPYPPETLSSEGRYPVTEAPIPPHGDRGRGKEEVTEEVHADANGAAPGWRGPADMKFLNHSDVQLREDSRKNAEAAAFDWRGYLASQGEVPL